MVLGLAACVLLLRAFFWEGVAQFYVLLLVPFLVSLGWLGHLAPGLRGSVRPPVRRFARVLSPAVLALQMGALALLLWQSR